MINCPNCGNKLNEGALFCGSCGQKIIQLNEEIKVDVNTCPHCNTPFEKDEKFCAECGNAINEGVATNKVITEEKIITKSKPQPISTTISNPSIKKKKGGILKTIGKIIAGFLAFIIIGSIILYNLGDDSDEDIEVTSISQEEIVDYSDDNTDREELNENLQFSETIIGELDKNEIQLEIPKNTFDQEVNLNVVVSENIPVFDKKRAKLFGKPFNISIDQKSKRLNEPVTIKLKLFDEEISKLEHPEDLWVGYYNGKQWDYFKPSEINLQNKYLTFETYHFSLFAKTKPTKEERINDYADKAAVEQWSSKNNNAPARQATEKIVQQVLGKYLGLGNKSLTQDIVESIMNESDYQKLLVSYNDNKMDQFGQDVAILAGKTIVKVVTEDSNAKAFLGGVTQHASKINTGINIARALSQGNLEQAAKDLSNEIINSFPMTKLFREAAKITDQQIVRWRDQELEAAYKVFVNGSQSAVPFWGYDVEPGNFDEVWIQMKGLKPQLLRDAKAKYALSKGVKVEDLGTRALEIIEDETKENIRKKFIQREKEEKEIEKLKEQNIKLIKIFEDANLLNKYRFGYTEQTSFELRLHRLYKIKDMILKDTKSKVGFLGVNGGGIIPAKTVARLIQIWYNPDGGKEKYREELIELGYIEEVEELELANGPWEISTFEANEIFSVIGSKEFNDGIVERIVEEFGGEKADPSNEINRDASIKTKQEKAEKKLDQEYKNTLEFGIINAPKAEYEKGEEYMFIYQYNPLFKDGIYTFSITEGFDLEKGDEIKFILQLKTDNYFEAKVFYKSKGYVSIDYMKGKLKI